MRRLALIGKFAERVVSGFREFDTIADIRGDKEVDMPCDTLFPASYSDGRLFVELIEPTYCGRAFLYLKNQGARIYDSYSLRLIGYLNGFHNYNLSSVIFDVLGNTWAGYTTYG